MRVKAIHVIRVALRTIDRVLNANLPMGSIWLNSSASPHKQEK
jgi:hypothetical protein